MPNIFQRIISRVRGGAQSVSHFTMLNREQRRAAAPAVARAVDAGTRFIASGGAIPTARPVQALTFPGLGPAGAVSAAGEAGALGRVGGRVGGFLEKSGAYLARQLSPKAVAQRATIAPLVFEGAKLTESAITGKPFSPIPNNRQLKALGGYVLGGLPGLALGSVESGAVETKDVFGFFKNKLQGPVSVPTLNIPTPTQRLPEFGGFTLNLPQQVPSFPSIDAGLSTPSSSINISSGGGGLGLEGLALAALAGGGLGFLLGHKKKRRRRKKYKHRKRKR